MSGSNIVRLEIKKRSQNGSAQSESLSQLRQDAASLECLLVAMNDQLIALEKQLVRIVEIVKSLGATPKARELLAEHARVSLSIADIKRDLQDAAIHSP